MTLRLAHRSLALDGPPCMMGIVNVTPDSFYDRGLTADPAAAVARGVELVAAGAGMIDVGGMTAQRRDDNLDPRDLLVLREHPARLGRHPADVDDAGARAHEVDAPADGRLGRGRGPAVVERVGGDVDDAHHAGRAVEGDRPAGEAQGHARTAADMSPAYPPPHPRSPGGEAPIP